MTHQMSPITQAVTMLAADRDRSNVYGPVGGPVMTDGTIALSVSVVGTLDTNTSSVGVMGGPLLGSGVIALSVDLNARNALDATQPVNLIATRDSTDGQVTQTAGVLLVQSRPMLYDAAADRWDRARAADATTQASTTAKDGVAVVAKASEWTATGEPAAATQATATRAAGGAGVVHVCTGLTVCLAAGATAAGPIKVRVLDGAATLWVGAMSAPVQGVGVIALDGLALVGTANTAMTLQFDAAGPAASQETVTLHGYST